MFIKIAILYVLIGLGYITKKKLSLSANKIGYILLYFILPSFIFGKLVTSDLVLFDLTKPLLVLIVSIALCICCFFIASKLWRNNSDYKNMKYLMAAAVPNSNTGYFGIPFAILLFSDKLLALYILAMMGMSIFQLTIGYYLYARSSMTFSDSIIRLLKFPSFWAMLIGLIINFNNIILPEFFYPLLSSITDITAFIFSIGGMFIIGLSLGDVQIKDINYRVLIWANILCFALWPLFAVILVFIDMQFLHWLGDGEEKILWLMALCPIGANAVLYANNFNLYPKDTALMVLTTTLLALPILGIASLTIL